MSEPERSRIRARDVGGESKLSTLDAACLLLDRPNQPLQMAAVVELDGCLDYEALLDVLSERLLALPRFRQRPVRSRYDLLPPVWEDDPSFDLSHHVRYVALPPPGDDERLRHVVETLYSAPLAPDRPLWEIHLIDGLSGRRSALLCKIHHCMSDGVGAIQILERIADRATESGAAETTPSVRLVPCSETSGTPQSQGDEQQSSAGRSPTAKAAAAAEEKDEEPEAAPKDAPQGLVEALLAVAGTLVDPPRLFERARDLAEVISTVATLAEQRASDLPFHGQLGHARRLVWRSFPLDEFQSLRTAADCTINDAVLAVVAGALRHYLDGQGVFPDDVTLRAAVPVSFRSNAQDADSGNLFTAVFPRLPVDVADPIERLRRARDEMRELKRRGQARATGLALAILGSLPWQAEAALLDLIPDRRFVDAVCTNVPGPRGTLSLLGRKIVEIHPIVPLFQRMGLGFAVASYRNRLSICATADPTLVEDADRVLSGIEDALYETRTALWERSEALAIASRLVRTPTVAELMSREVPTVGAADSVRHAHQIMRENRLRHLPVVDDAFHLIGVLTQGDLLVADEAPLPASESGEEPLRAPEDALAGAHAANVRAARAALALAAPHETAFEAGRRMVENETDFLPVVDDAGKLLGLVTQEHFLRWTTSRMADQPPAGRGGPRPA
jgi:diacylglycerol O-acyltransferase / wax synthase